jgi:hypothetical protein
MYNEGIRTFLAGEDLEARRRVKIKSATTTTPPEVVYADAGEDYIGVTEYAVESGDPIACRLNTYPGTLEIECVVDSEIARGTVLYGANDGKVSDAASGTAQGIALEAGADNQHIEVAAWNVKSTTAATVSVADSGSLITGTTVEAALAEIMQGIKTAQHTVVPSQIRLEDGTELGKFADGASGVGWAQLSNKDLGIRWNNQATPDDIIMQFVMPQDFNDEANVVLHLMGAIVKAGADEADSPVVTVEAYFSEVGANPAADTDCGGESGEFLTTADAAYQEKTLTITAANAPAAPCVLTCVLHPKDGQLETDDFVLLTPWLEVTRKCLTA